MPLFQRLMRTEFYPKVFTPEARPSARQPPAVQVRLRGLRQVVFPGKEPLLGA